MKLVLICPDCGSEDIKFSKNVNISTFVCAKCKKRFNKDNSGVRALDNGNVSDGSHTFNELYYHRMNLFAVICNSYKDIAWKSWKHHDGSMFQDYFIVGIDTPEGQYSYHYHKSHWDEFKVKVLEFAPEWDGHKPEDITRLMSIVKKQSTNHLTNEYDMESLFLFQDGYDYQIGYITKVNEKSLTMSCGARLPKSEFYKAHKLTFEEEVVYRGELMKRLTPIKFEIESMCKSLKSLRSILKLEEFATINREKLQKALDEMEESISTHLNEVIVLGGKELKLSNWTKFIKEVKDNESI